MAGTMSNEELIYTMAEVADPSMLDGYNDESVWQSFAIYQMFLERSLLNTTDKCDEQYASMAKNFYFGDTLDSDDLLSYINFGSDVKFGFPTNMYIDYLAGSPVPVYNYIMTFQDNTSFSFAGYSVGKGLG